MTDEIKCADESIHTQSPQHQYQALAVLLYQEAVDGEPFLGRFCVKKALGLDEHSSSVKTRASLLTDMQQSFGLSLPWSGLGSVPPAAILLWCRMRGIDEHFLPVAYRQAADMKYMKELIDVTVKRQNEAQARTRSALSDAGRRSQ